MKWQVVLFSLCLSACIAQADMTHEENEASAVQAASVVQAVVERPYTWVLRDKAVLRQAQKQLAQLQDKPIYVFEKIHFFDGTRPRIELAIQDFRQPEKLVFYTFEQGKWTPSEAEDIRHIQDLSSHLFALNEVDFAQAADIAQIWQNKAHEVNAVETTPYYVSFVHLPKQNKNFWHTATLEAVGKQYYLSCYADGRVWEFKRLAGQD